jgi:uncharacterized LabA/DUF88 family protein
MMQKVSVQELPVNMNSSIPVSQGQCAVLVDGENIHCEFAAEILKHARQLGDLKVRRVYGNGDKIPGWKEQPSFKFVYTHCAKNSADMKLVIDAMELACTGSVDRFVVATSDGDFTHLAFALVERGLKVLGLGENKVPDMFREACSEFIQVGPDKSSVKPNSNLDTRTLQAVQIIKRDSGKNGLSIQLLGGKMYHEHEIRVSSLNEKNWRAFLTAQPSVFECDSKGSQARVRVKGK